MFPIKPEPNSVPATLGFGGLVIFPIYFWWPHFYLLIWVYLLSFISDWWQLCWQCGDICEQSEVTKMNNCRYTRGLLLWPLHACVDKAGGVRNPLPFASTSLHGTLPNGLAKGKACQSPVQNLLHRWTPSVAAPWRTVSSPSCVNGFPCFYQISLTLGLGFFLSLNIKRQY